MVILITEILSQYMYKNILYTVSRSKICFTIEHNIEILVYILVDVVYTKCQWEIYRKPLITTLNQRCM